MSLPRYVSPREKLNYHSWLWKDEPVDDSEANTQQKFPQVALTEGNRNILFHWGWSGGTSVVRGDQPFTIGNNYYWEMELGTAPYGTDVMVGVGTADVKLFSSGVYVSVLGMSQDSWGLSYTGKFHHDGYLFADTAMKFGCGDFVGLHLDMWNSSLSFFVNGVAVCVVNDKSLKKQTLYPMVSSTSASISLRLIYSYSSKGMLQDMCSKRLESVTNGLSMVSKIPGLFKECTKRFVEVKYATKTSEEHCCELGGNLDIVDTDVESSEGENEISMAEEQQSRQLQFKDAKVC